jgi:peroxiredoxin
MNSRMKSFFFLPAVAVSAVLAVAAIASAVMGNHDRLAWWGAAVANFPLLLFYAYLKLVRIARTSDNLPLLVLLSSAGAIVALWESLMAGNAGWQPAAVAIAGTALLLLYVFWYSRFGRMPNPRLEVGNKLPDFSLTDLVGGRVDSAQFLGRPTINLFYRGSWCQFCVAQLHEIAARFRDLDNLGVRVNLISSQPEDKTRELANDLKAPLRFLVDRDATVAHALDIAESNAAPLGSAAGFAADSAMPTVIVTNASGTILFSDQTDIYRVRPEPDIYIAILRRAGAVAT